MRIWKKCVAPLAVGILLTSAAGVAQADTTGKVTWEVPASTSFTGSSVTDDALAGPDRDSGTRSRSTPSTCPPHGTASSLTTRRPISTMPLPSGVPART